MKTKSERLASLEKEVATLKKKWDALSKAITIIELPKAIPRNYSGYSG